MTLTPRRLWRPSLSSSIHKTKKPQKSRSCIKILQLLLILVIVAYSSLLLRLPTIGTGTSSSSTSSSSAATTTQNDHHHASDGQNVVAVHHGVKKHLGEFIQQKSKQPPKATIDSSVKKIQTQEENKTQHPTTTDEIDYWNLNHSLFYTIPSDENDGNLWDVDPIISKQIPQWMKSYFNWHKYKQKTVLQSNDKDPQTLFNENRWLIMQCLGEHDNKCGGTADRLKTLPWMIRVAYYTRRILLIRWTKPKTLESYLVPPVGGIDWRVKTDWLLDIVSVVVCFCIVLLCLSAMFCCNVTSGLLIPIFFSDFWTLLDVK